MKSAQAYHDEHLARHKSLQGRKDAISPGSGFDSETRRDYMESPGSNRSIGGAGEDTRFSPSVGQLGGNPTGGSTLSKIGTGATSGATNASEGGESSASGDSRRDASGKLINVSGNGSGTSSGSSGSGGSGSPEAGFTEVGYSRE